MPEARAMTGGCHCGKVRFEVEADLTQTISCNCSICQKTGSILTFVPGAKFKLTSGADALTDYQFNKMIVHHVFCSTCGIRSFARATKPDGSEGVAVNVRCLDGVDLDSLKPRHFDGKSL